MQFAAEEQLKTRLRQNWVVLMAVIALALAVWARLGLLQFESVDYTEHLKGWFTTLATTPGLEAFRQPTWNYTPPYIYLLKLATIPLADHPLRAVKSLALVFDAVLALSVYLLVRYRYPRSRPTAVAAALVVLFSPTVIFNGALWAQSDATYTSVLLLCLFAVVRHQHALAFVLFGIAASFKLQAMFLLPLLCVVYLRRRFSLAYFLIVPLTYLVIVTPALLAGMPLRNALSVYSDQFASYRQLAYNAPTVYQWVPNQYYELFVPFGTALALAVGLGITSLALVSERRLTSDVLVRMALALTLAVPYVTPKMQDRYFFPADVLSVVYAFYVPRRFYVPVTVTLCSLFSYFPFLFGQTPVPLVFVSLALLVPVAVVLRDYALALFSAPLGQDGRLLTAIEESDTLAPGLGGVFAVEKQPKNVGL
jgi:Gpi18-like mannosyltransferase